MNFFNFNKNSLNTGNVAKCCFDFWNGHYRLVFFIFSLVILFSGMYFWYQSLFRSDWSSEEKNQYKKTQNKEVEFHEQEFRNVVEEIGRRERVFKEAPKSAKNIFKPYAGDQEATVQPVNGSVPML